MYTTTYVHTYNGFVCILTGLCNVVENTKFKCNFSSFAVTWFSSNRHDSQALVCSGVCNNLSWKKSRGPSEC